MSRELKITREELYEKVWQKPTVKIAEEFGISDVMIAKFCRKLNIPKPPPGYWRRIETDAKFAIIRLKIKKLTTISSCQFY